MDDALVVFTAVVLSSFLAGIAGRRAFLATVSPLRAHTIPLPPTTSPLPMAWLVARRSSAGDVTALPHPDEVRCAGLIAGSFAGLVVFSAASFATALGYLAIATP